MKNPGSFEDLVVQEGDIIRIPKRLETVQVTGEVLYPTTVKYGKGLSFADYISHSGGFTTRSLRKSSYIKYPNGSVDRTRKFMFFNVYPKVQPGSEIFVPSQRSSFFNSTTSDSNNYWCVEFCNDINCNNSRLPYFKVNHNRMSNMTNQVSEEQITPREVILKVVAAKNALLKSWKAFLLFIILGFGIGYAMDIYLIKPNSYEADDRI